MDKSKVFITYRGELDDRLDVDFINNKDRLEIVKKTNYPVEKMGISVLMKRGRFSHRPRNDVRFFDGSYPFIQTGDIVRANSKNKKIEYTQTLNDRGLSVSKLFNPNLLLITIAANIGYTAILDYPACFPDSLVACEPKNDKLLLEYLDFYMTLIRPYVESLSPKFAQRNINLEQLSKLPIIIPPIKKQKEIIDIVQIANEFKNACKEKAKQHLTNFENLVSKKGFNVPQFENKSPQINYILSLEGALNVERYAFTYKLKNPEKWKTIKEAGDVKIQTLTPSDDFNKERPFTLLRIDDLPNKPFKPVSRSVHGSDVEGNLQNINTNDVLVARLAPTVRNKKIIIAPESDLPIIGSNEFIRFTCNEENNPIFVCYLLRTEFYTELMLSKSRGSTPSRYRLSRADFEKLPFPIVPKAIQDEIAAEYLKNIEEAQRLIKEGKEAVKKAKKEVEEMILGE